MKFNLSKLIAENFVGKMMDGKLIDRAFLTYEQNGGDVVIRVHFSPVEYMDHIEIPIGWDIELTEPE